MKIFPDVPTFRELGYDFINETVFMIAAPKGTPAPVIKKLDEALHKGMEDPEFVKQEALLAYLQRHAPFTTLLKSASYLLHDNQFAKVRGVVLTGSRAVLQDDTGVPFRFFDTSAWNIRLFGRYSPPVKDFNYGRQPDLEAAYRAAAAVRDLPFAFGYHWRQGTSSVMLAIRTAGVR